MGDLDGGAARLAEAGGLLQHGDLVFGWRLALKHQLLGARLALLRGDPADALAAATALGERAAALRVPRYTSAARLVTHRARHALRLPVDPAAVAADLDALDQSVSIEAWWWTGELAADFGQPAWLDRAAGQAARLAAAAGPYGDGLRQAAGQRLDRWRAAAQLPGQHAVTSAIDTVSGAGPAAAWPAACATARSAARRAAVRAGASRLRRNGAN